MPYDVKKQGNKYVTYNTETGDVKGTHDTREKAMKQLRLLYMVKSGKEPTKNK